MPTSYKHSESRVQSRFLGERNALEDGSMSKGLSERIDDPRKPSNDTLNNFQEILVIAVAAMPSDCDTVYNIAFWARAKEAWLRRFQILKNGIPCEWALRFHPLGPNSFSVFALSPTGVSTFCLFFLALLGS